jgi:diguanylate cyclase
MGWESASETGKEPPHVGGEASMSVSKPSQLERARLLRRIGTFFDEHELDATPANYALVYRLFADSGSALAAAVRAATSDGIRLTQRDADRLLKEAGMETGPAPSVSGALLVEAQRQVDEFAAIVEATRAEAKSYGDDLQAGADRLVAANDAADAADLLKIVHAMVDRARDAETQLADARREAQGLRVKLAEASEEARSDVLTRLPNRRAFEDRFAELRAAGGPISLAICDIDNFKRINDEYGHAVGDRVLRTVASLLQASCEGHMVARLGGEEFVVLFDGVPCSEAADVVDTARTLLAAKHFRVRGTDAAIGRITFSAGIAGGKGPGAEDLLKRADELLYRAKDSGRNQVLAEKA